VFYLTGWRRGEVQSVESRDVDLSGGAIRLQATHSKNKRPRMVALRGGLLALIEQRASLRVTDCPHVFHRGGRPLGDIRKAWQTACRAAGLEGRIFHDMHRSAVRNMVRAGVPERVAMAVSGHRTRAVFDRYNIVSEDDLAAAMERTDAYVTTRREAPRRIVPLAAHRARIEHGQNTDSRGNKADAGRETKLVSIRSSKSHPSESNRRPTDYESVALPTELGWQTYTVQDLGQLLQTRLRHTVPLSVL